MADPIAASREIARARAAKILRMHSYSEEPDGSFSGELVHNDQRIAIRCVLPRKFPDEPPAIFVKNTAIISRRSHVERDGKLCLFPNTGLLLDADRPEKIVLDSIKRAADVLFESEDDYKLEFLAYWHQPYKPGLLSIISDIERSHVLAAVMTNKFLVVGDNPDSLQEWLKRVGWRANQSHDAFLVPLNELPDAPPFNTYINQADLSNVLRQHAADGDRTAFESWLRTTGLPAFLVLSAPAPDDSGSVVFAAELRKAEVGKSADRLNKGFRPGKLPAALEVDRSSDQPAVRIEPHRADAEYVISRVGGDVELLAASVVIVGCGSLGSQIAVNLAASGIGTITLVDHEVLSPDNVHRHVLGMSCIGEHKASALSKHIHNRLPHLTVRSIDKDIDAVITDQPEFLSNHDLVILATGDETLERRLNTIFESSMPRIHAWLEPLGVGGHVLLAGESSCFGCLYKSDENGLYNMASLVRRGQDFLRSVGGCAGSFTPFGFVDAAQGAVEVARMVLRVFREDNVEPQLVSWIGEVDQFKLAGYELSKRGERALAQRRIIDSHYGSRDCRRCHGS